MKNNSINKNITNTATATAPAIDQSALIKALDSLFSDEKAGYEIPDSAIVGRFSKKFEQLQAQVGTLTAELLKLKGGTPAPAPVVPGRINPTTAAKGK